MVRVMTLLAVWQLRNAVRTSLTDVRKLIPLLVIAFFIGTQMLSWMLMAGQRPPTLAAPEVLLDQAELIRTGAFLVLVLITIGILDYGFTEGFLAFSLADVDYLFPSPIPRRLILAYRLAAKTCMSLFQASFFFYFFLWRTLQAFAPEKATLAAGFVAFLGLFCCLGGYANLAFALKMVFGFGRLGTVRRGVLALLAVFLALVGYTYWQAGFGGVREFAQNVVMIGLFLPCSMAADCLAAPLRGTSTVAPLGVLAAFYAGTLAFLFSRNENFYEASLEGSEKAAKMLQAAKEQNFSAMFAIQAAGKRAVGRKPYALPPFGRGGVALLWANLSAAARRPFANFWLPLLGGLGIGLVLVLTAPGRYAAWLVGGANAYALFILTMSGMQVFRQSVGREPLIRPLPFRRWEVVVADVLPRTLISALFAWGSGAVLLFSQADHALTVAVLLIVCLPVALFALNLVQYMIALWYPDAQDKLQQMLAGFISLFLTMGVITLMAIGLVVPLLLRAPVWAVSIAFLIPSGAAGALLLWWAAAVYGRFQPKG
jgi:hypothetical protein